MKAWLKKWWWVLLLIGAAVGGLVLFLVFRKGKRQGGMVDSFSAKARREIVESETTLKIEKLKAKAETEAKEKQLGEIANIEDGAERRVKLARFLDETL